MKKIGITVALLFGLGAVSTVIALQIEHAAYAAGSADAVPTSPAIAPPPAVSLPNPIVASGTSNAIAFPSPLPTISVTNPIATGADAWDAMKQLGIFWGGMLVLFSLGTAFIKKAEEDHWLAQGNTLPILTGVIGTIGSVIAAKFAGGSWAVVPGTVMSWIFLLIQHKPKSAADAGGGTMAKVVSSSMVVALVFSGTASLTMACSGTTAATIKKDAGEVASGLLDCAKVDVGQTPQEIGMTILSYVAQVVMSGQAGWEAALEKIGEKYGKDTLACALHDVELVFGAHVGTGSAATAGDKPPAALRARSYIDTQHWSFK